MQQRRNVNREAVFAFYLFSVLAAVSFILAVVVTLPVFDQRLAVGLYQLMMKTFAGTLILAEMAELFADPVPTKFAWLLCLLSIVGNCLYIWSSSAYS